MKIILLQDVKSVGKKGDIIDANDGYARNFLIPKKMGVPANAENMNTLKLQKSNEAKVAQEQLEEAQRFAKELEEKTIEVTLKTGKDGRSFGSISAKEIAEAAKKQFGYELDKKKMHIPDAIKNLGTYNITIRLHQKVTAELKVHVSEQ